MAYDIPPEAHQIATGESFGSGHHHTTDQPKAHHGESDGLASGSCSEYAEPSPPPRPDTMSVVRKHAPADATADSLSLIAAKLDSMDERIDGRLGSLEGGQATLAKGQATLMENQLETNRSLAAIMAHLGIPKG